MKKCNTCLKEKEQEEFCKTRPKNNKCRACLRETSKKFYLENRDKELKRSKKWREENKELFAAICKKRYDEKWAEVRRKANESRKNPESRKKEYENRRKYPEKSKARDFLRYCVRRGYVKKPEFCDICKSNKKLEGHHHDYLKPIDVQWLCKICHTKIHKE